MHGHMNVKFIRKSYLGSEKYFQLEGTDQNRRKKYKLYYINILWGYELDLAQNLEYRRAVLYVILKI